METANTVMLIVTIVILLALSFFIFQIWVHSKETKLQLANFLQEIQRGFANSDSNLRTEINRVHLSVDILKEQIKQFDTDIKLFKERIDDRVKQMDKHLTEKLVEDLTNITKQQSDKFNEKHLAVLNEFSKTSKDIKEEQNRILKAITEPLKINVGND